MPAKLPTVSILIPCHNESLGIRACLRSCVQQTIPFNKIIVVDDASTDNTVEIIERSFNLKKNHIQLIKLTKNKGNKSYVQEHGLQFIDTEIFVATDGDTVLSPNFVEKLLPHFQDPQVHAAAGRVKSLRDNWLTACREIDYNIAQLIHKRAQSEINAVVVIPGCAGAFRTQTFKQHITFDHDTLTEDLDFTYKLHLQNYKIVFEPDAIVYTQDPADLKSYIKQMTRWYTGNFQNMRKHSQTLLKKPALAIEITLAYTEGILFSIIIFLLPILNPNLAMLLIAPFLLTSLIVASWVAYKDRRLDLIFYSPMMLLVIYINSAIFMRELYKVMVLNKKDLIWHKAARKQIQ
jgi:cellulose synthase/poly-beta-1,6-N-acetylglucosamine synthase-like glycosyltransferase